MSELAWIMLGFAVLFVVLVVITVLSIRRAERSDWCEHYTKWLGEWQGFERTLKDAGYEGDSWLTAKIAEEERGVEKWCKP